MAAVLQAKLSPSVVRDVMLTARQYDAKAALAAGIIDEVVEGNGAQVIERACQLAQMHSEHAASGVSTAWQSVASCQFSTDMIRPTRSLE